MANRSPEKNEIEHPYSDLDAAAGLTIKVFISLVFTVGAIIAVLITVGFVFGVWSTMDNGLGTVTANVN